MIGGNPRAQINALVSALIDGTFQCYDAAADTIVARLGNGVSKATISRRRSGSLDWPLADILALEDAAGKYPVTRMMARRLKETGAGSSLCITRQAGAISKECGEAVAAILSAQSSAEDNCRADALSEIDEAIEALRTARATIEAGG
ncbi:hypothetical protein AN189_07390 [Loktanella sp. 3ANDIMAR09]|uniref:hypothetical protein n=1 Tax=Loktanella sp. 3ANDIMAR09 TaxID=1225657 RepID=UPI0006F50D14|nr:hypothetical protein [Loktanella sp. 3ANDIMAR09]KQI68715.1 hypothetical protein AN189_07390 [Loktanella sp. 3ANDIMAR09]